MWQVVKEGPAPRPQARERAPAWQALRAAVVRVAGHALALKPPVPQGDVQAREQAVAFEVGRPQAPHGGRGVRVVEAVVLLAVGAYFVVGLVAVLLA
jgi:hypothetical protein